MRWKEAAEKMSSYLLNYIQFWAWNLYMNFQYSFIMMAWVLSILGITFFLQLSAKRSCKDLTKLWFFCKSIFLLSDIQLYFTFSSYTDIGGVWEMNQPVCYGGRWTLEVPSQAPCIPARVQWPCLGGGVAGQPEEEEEEDPLLVHQSEEYLSEQLRDREHSLIIIHCAHLRLRIKSSIWYSAVPRPEILQEWFWIWLDTMQYLVFCWSVSCSAVGHWSLLNPGHQWNQGPRNLVQSCQSSTFLSIPEFPSAPTKIKKNNFKHSKTFK